MTADTLGNDGEAYRGTFDVDAADEPSTSIVEAIATIDDRDPTRSTTPLYDSIDPTALEAVLAPRSDGTRRDVTVSFTHAGYQITVSGSGRFRIDRTDDET